MKINLIYIFVASLILHSCGGNRKCNDASYKSPLACKLTSAEIRERKATVLASLQKQIVEKKELDRGYSFRFNDGNMIHSELNEFVKTEKQCCEFFEFNIFKAHPLLMKSFK